jgi:DNA polymerase phi
MSTASAPILNLFWDLASTDEPKRIEACSSLVTILSEAQEAHGASASSGGGSPCTDITYTVRRLVRGLASSRDGARQGFGTALIEVLRAFGDAVELESVLAVMEESMTLHGSMHGAEERDVLFGRVFTCASILRSGRVAALPAPRRGALAASLSRELLQCSTKKSFLQELCATLQCELLATLQNDDVQAAIWPQLSPSLSAPLADWSAHTLLLALRLSRSLPRATMAPSSTPPTCRRSSPRSRLPPLPTLVCMPCGRRS